MNHEAEDSRRSESVYRSAAALAALVRLCMSNYDYNEFYISVAAVEPIFHLDSLVKALDDSHPKKKLFLSLTTIARVPLHFIKNPKQFKSHSEFAHTLRQSLLKIFELCRCVTLSHLKYCSYEQHPRGRSSEHYLLGITNACLLFARASSYLYWMQGCAFEPTPASESVVETLYFLLHLLIFQFDSSVYSLSRTEHLERLIISTCAHWFDDIESIISQNAWYFDTDSVKLALLVRAFHCPLSA